MFNCFSQNSNPYKSVFENFMKINPMLSGMNQMNGCQSNSSSTQSCSQGSSSCPISNFNKMMSCCCNNQMNHPMMGCCTNSCCSSNSCGDGFGIHKMMMDKYINITSCMLHFTEETMCKMKNCHKDFNSGSNKDSCRKDSCNSSSSCHSGGESGNYCMGEWLKHLESKVTWWSENFGKFHCEIVKLNEQASANMKLIAENIKVIQEQMSEYKKINSGVSCNDDRKQDDRRDRK